MATSKAELLPLEGAINGIWRFFGFPAKDGQFLEKDKKKRNEVTCKLCFQVLKYASNTTNMRFHLQTHHHREYAAIWSRKKELGQPVVAVVPIIHTSIFSHCHQLLALVFLCCVMLIHGIIFH